jgi:D-3-phosphoglycerate dehydrogenase / 2-oxoglutarate reductase
MFYITEKQFYTKETLSIYNKIGAIFSSNTHKIKVKILIIRLKFLINSKFLKEYKNLKYIITNTTGLDHIDLIYCKKKNITIISLNDIMNKIQKVQSTADLTFGLIINLSRNITYSNKYLDKNKIFDRYKFISHDLNGRTLGIVGLGRIGKRVAKYAKCFGMKVIGHDKYKSQNYFEKNSVTKVSKEKLLKKSNIISIHSSSEKLKKILDTQDLLKIKKGAILVNTSRDFLIDQKILFKLIKSKHLIGYGTDVLPNERNKLLFRKNEIFKLSKNYNVLITPHLGGCTFESLNNTDLEIAKYFYKRYKK